MSCITCARTGESICRRTVVVVVVVVVPVGRCRQRERDDVRPQTPRAPHDLSRRSLSSPTTAAQSSTDKSPASIIVALFVPQSVIFIADSRLLDYPSKSQEYHDPHPFRAGGTDHHVP